MNRPQTSMLLVACSVLVPAMFLACGGPPAADPPAPPSTDASAAATPPATPSTTPADKPAAMETAKPTTTTAAATSAPAPATSRALETAVQTKTTSAGGSYAVGAVTANGIAEADVVQTLNAAAAKTDACYVPLFKKQLGVKGLTSFEVEIDAKGKTKSVSLKENELKDTTIAKCLTDVIKKLAWPTPLKAPATTKVAWVVTGN